MKYQVIIFTFRRKDFKKYFQRKTYFTEIFFRYKNIFKLYKSV